MSIDTDTLYEAFKANDSQLDGRYFMGVTSTGIYCRPVCGARMPKKENCRFFTSAAEAEQAGFRPCLICRPELAPGRSISDATSNLALRAARTLRDTCGSGESIETLAGKLGYTDRHLRRVFERTYHLTPVQYVQTCRLLTAKNLLTDSNLSIGDIALASGFKSVRRFNEAFKSHYRMAPSSLRKEASHKGTNERGISSSAISLSGISLKLGYRPPYAWESMLHFLESRAIETIEVIRDNAYYRTVSMKTNTGKLITGWIKVSNLPERNCIRLTMSESLLPVLTHVVARVRLLFDLDAEPALIYNALKSMEGIKPGSLRQGTRLPGSFDAFETAARAIIGQWISIQNANVQAAKVAQKYGTPIQTGVPGLSRSFPTADWVVRQGTHLLDDFGNLGITSARSKAILALAQAIIHGNVLLEPVSDPQEQMSNMLALKGIGPWTANYIAMRTMGYTDAFLETDSGIKHALEGTNSKEMLDMAENWRPWRSYAVVNLWNTL